MCVCDGTGYSWTECKYVNVKGQVTVGLSVRCVNVKGQVTIGLSVRCVYVKGQVIQLD